MIVLVTVVLNRTVIVTDVSTTRAVVIFSVKCVVSCQLMVLNSGYWPDWSIKSQCYWSFDN